MSVVGPSELKDMIVKAVEDALDKRDGLKKALDNQEPHDAHVMHCPDCYKNIIEGLNRTSEMFCTDCGLPLGSAEMAKKLDHCPNCRGTTAKPR